MQNLHDTAALLAENRRLREALDIAEETITQLRESMYVDEDIWWPPVELGLTKYEARMVGILYKARGKPLTKEALLFAMYNDVDEQPTLKIIDVWVCRLRKKLEPYSIVIETLWGMGYRLTSDSLPTLDAWRQDEAA